MPVKVYFQDEIHRFAKLSGNLSALLETLTSSFNHQLPSSWTVKYMDCDGDDITLTHDRDYAELLQAESNDSALTVKLTIIPVQGTKSSLIHVIDREERHVKEVIILKK